MSIAACPTNDPAIPMASWDSETQDLLVQFANGNSYQFEGVPRRFYREFIEHRDPRKYVRTKLMLRFDFVKVT